MLAKLVILHHVEPLGILSSGNHSYVKRLRKLKSIKTFRDAENSEFQWSEESHFGKQEKRALDKQECGTIDHA